jgi:hypothetical protein
MAKDNQQPPVKVDFGAHIGAEAKFEVKGEIPSSSLGRLVDALTDAIRPFTESRGLRGDQIRLQREDIAIEIAKRTQRRLLIENSPVRPVPNKILVPLLEKASIESADDDFMLDRWANLLASASAEGNVEPRYVALLSELSGRQARVFQGVALNNYEALLSSRWGPPHDFTSDGPSRLHHSLLDATRSLDSARVLREAKYWWSERLGELKARRSDQEEKDMLSEFCRYSLSELNVPGCAVLYLSVQSSPGGHYIVNIVEPDLAINPNTPNYNDPDSNSNPKWDDHKLDLEILASLGLLRFVHIEFENDFKDRMESRYYHITELGLSFFQSCNRVANR